ncbi:MAG: DUF3524 domain-containing protein [Spongiibacteraceae bacterium]
MKVLVLSAYDAASHQHWYRTLMEAFPEFDWTLLSLPARYFSWRVRGNSLSWAFNQRELLEQSYDLVVATSMVDLSALRGFVPKLGLIPSLVYFHENQFVYPDSGKQFPSVEPKILSLYTALAADRVAFNSCYNRDTFLLGAQQLLARLPDQVPMGLLDQLTAVSEVLPVPVADHCFLATQPSKFGPLQLLWNHRWEYDKAPERLFAAIKRVLESGVDIKLHVVGQQFRQMPAVFEKMRAFLELNYPAVLLHYGYIEESSQYRQILTEADVVISTALHDFQGLAVLEAVAAGCQPLLPNRLCYSEWFGPEYLYDSYLEQPEQEADALAECIIGLSHAKQLGDFMAAPSVKNLSMTALKTQYADLFQRTIEAFQVRSTL